MVCVAVAGEGSSPHSRDLVERLSYFFGRGFGDAIARCQERGRAMVLVTEALSQPLVARLAASLFPWQFSNLRMCGILEFPPEIAIDHLSEKLTSIEDVEEEELKDVLTEFQLERHLQHIVECPAAPRGNIYGSTTHVHVLQSRKVQFAERLKLAFKHYYKHHLQETKLGQNKEKERAKSELQRLEGEQQRFGSSFWNRYARAQQIVLIKLDSLLWMFIILSLVITDCTVQALYRNSEELLWKDMFDYWVMITFLGDVIFRMWAMGVRPYFRSGLCVIDFILSAVDITTVVIEAAVADSESGSSSYTSALGALRMLRFVRLVRLVRVFSNDEMRMFLAKGRKDIADADSVVVPMMMLVVNGEGESATVDTLQAVRRQWDIVVLAGTGGLADKISTAWQEKKTAENQLEMGKPSMPRSFDSNIDEIVSFGRLNILNIKHDKVEDVTRLLISRCCGNNMENNDKDSISGSRTLYEAWKLYGELNTTGHKERAHSVLALQILVFLSVLETFLVTLRFHFSFAGKMLNFHFNLESDAGQGCSAPAFTCAVCPHEEDSLLMLIVSLPILHAVLLAVRNKFLPASKYQALFSAAENVKKHVYLYRTRTGAYSNEKFRDSKLGDCLLSTSTLLSKTEAVSAKLVNGDPLETQWLYTIEGREDALNILHTEDTALGSLDVEMYIMVRVADRQQFFLERAAYLQKLQSLGNTAVYILGGVSTLFVVFGLYKWVAVSISMMEALQTILAQEQIEMRTVKFNEGYAHLTNLRDWWNSLSEGDQIKKVNRSKMIQTTEEIISAVMVMNDFIEEEVEEDGNEETEAGQTKADNEEDLQENSDGGRADDEDGDRSILDPSYAEEEELVESTLRSGGVHLKESRLEIEIPRGDVNPKDQRYQTRSSLTLMLVSEQKSRHAYIPMPTCLYAFLLQQRLLSQAKRRLATALCVPYTSNMKEVPPSQLYQFIVGDIMVRGRVEHLCCQDSYMLLTIIRSRSTRHQTMVDLKWRRTINLMAIRLRLQKRILRELRNLGRINSLAS